MWVVTKDGNENEINPFTGTLRINAIAVNDAPVANDDAYNSTAARPPVRGDT